MNCGYKTLILNINSQQPAAAECGGMSGDALDPAYPKPRNPTGGCGPGRPQAQDMGFKPDSGCVL